MVEEIAVLTNVSSSAQADIFFALAIDFATDFATGRKVCAPQKRPACQENKTCPEPLWLGAAKIWINSKNVEKASHLPPWPYKFQVSPVLETYQSIYNSCATICHKLKCHNFHDHHSWTAFAAVHPKSSCNSIEILMQEANRLSEQLQGNLVSSSAAEVHGDSDEAGIGTTRVSRNYLSLIYYRKGFMRSWHLCITHNNTWNVAQLQLDFTEE